MEGGEAQRSRKGIILSSREEGFQGKLNFFCEFVWKTVVANADYRQL